MTIGFKATLFAGVISLSAFAPAFAAAPVISGLPDVAIGDLEDSTMATDNNLFVYSDAFNFNDYVTDTDTADKSQLLWSFAEFDGGLDASQYTINGVGPINVGTTEITDEELAGNPKASAPGASRVNGSSDLASFRDIILSPAAGSIPFGDPTPGQATTAEAGKFIRYYVADPEGNVDSFDALISTVDDGNDMLTESDGYREVVDDTDLSSWVATQSGVLPAVTWAKTPGNLSVTVAPAAHTSRYAGWINKELMSYDDVGPSKYVHGKFYIYTSNGIFTQQGGITPINEIPAFRIRLTNEDAVAAAIHYEYARTGNSATPTEPAYAENNFPATELYTLFIRPSDSAVTPSLYKIDLDPVDVPAAIGSDIGALFESYTQVDPANGTLTLAEVVLGTYDAKTDAEGTLLYEYNRNLGIAGGAGGPKAMVGGGFNAENSFIAGKVRDLELAFPPYSEPGPYAQNLDQGAAGIFMTTDGVASDVFGIDVINLTQADDTNRLRIEPGKLYRARYYLTAGLPATSVNPLDEVQGNIVCRFQTVAGSVSYRTELNSLAVVANGFGYGVQGNAIAEQALPSSQSQNPETDATLNTVGEAGGWYSVIVSSPLDTDAIRKDYQEFDPDNNGFFFLGAEPGPGEAGASAKDVEVGVDLLSGPTSLDVGTGTDLPFATPNRAEVRLSAIEVYEYPSIDDGGYDFDGL